MTFRATSISVLAALAVSAGGALAQSGSASFCESGYSTSDADSDGVIDRDELGKATEVAFSELDANGDGMVSQDEYLECRTGWMPNSAIEDTLSREDVTVLDGNQDGRIDQGEFMGRADQEYSARWSETGTDKEVRDADFAPVTPEDEGGVGDTQAEASGGSQGGAPAATQGDAQTAEAAKATGDSAGKGAQQGLILRRIIFLPTGDGRGPGDMSRDEVAQRSAQKFLLLDTDSNKAIEPDEGAEADDMSMEEKNNIVRAILHQNFNQEFDRIDADKSGDVSREEYAADAEGRWQAAKERAMSGNAQASGDAQSSGSAQSDTGAPVVYFHYPHPM